MVEKTDSPTVAIIGASADPAKYSFRSLQAHRRKGYQVFPINPKGGEIDGLTVYTSIDAVPIKHLDRVSMYVPPSVGEKLLEAIAQKGCDELWLNPGSESPELVTRAEELGLNVIQACSLIDASN